MPDDSGDNMRAGMWFIVSIPKEETEIAERSRPESRATLSEGKVLQHSTRKVHDPDLVYIFWPNGDYRLRIWASDSSRQAERTVVWAFIVFPPFLPSR